MLAVTGLVGAFCFFPTCFSCRVGKGPGGVPIVPHKQPPAIALFLLLPPNVLAPAAGVTLGTEVVSAVSQTVSATEVLPGASEAESLLCSQQR